MTTRSPQHCPGRNPAPRSYCGIGDGVAEAASGAADGGGEAVSTAGATAAPDISNTRCFCLCSFSSPGCFWALRSCFSLSLWAFIFESSGIRARISAETCCIILSLSAFSCGGSRLALCDSTSGGIARAFVVDFRFQPTFSPFHLTLSFFRPPLSLFRVAADVSVKRVITDSCVTDARRVVDHGLVTHGIVFETTTLDWSALWPTALLKVPSPLVKSAKAPTAVLSSPVVLLNSAPAPTAVFSGPLLTRSVTPPTAVQKLPSVRLRTA